MFLEDWFKNADLRPLLVVAIFLVVVIAAIVLVEADHRNRMRKIRNDEYDPEEMKRIVKNVIDQARYNTELDARMFANVEEYRRDFDGPYQAS